MHNVFTPGTVTCLDESLVAYHRDSSPAWDPAGRKPRPHGFVYHTMVDAATAVIFRMELLEGRHQPPQAAPPAPRQGSKAALLDRMTLALRSKSHNVVILDPALDVIQGLVDLALNGVYAAAVVRKRKACWPRHVPGDAILAYMKDKPVGELHVAQGVVGGVQINFNCVRHSRYTFILASTYGSHVVRDPPLKLWAPSGGRFTVQCNEVLTDYYAARHAVEDNNRNRHGTADGLERAWAPCTNWERRHLAFLVALTESNALRIYNRFVARQSLRDPLRLLDFRLQVIEGIFEALHPDVAAPPHGANRSGPGQAHFLQAIPLHRGAWNGQSYNTAKSKYQKTTCKGGKNPRTGSKCTAQIRTVCACTPGLFLCIDCFGQHVREEEES